MPGPKPKPTHLKLIEGNRGRQKLNKSEPVPIGELKTPPDWLTDEQKAGWQYAIKHAPLGLLKKLDRSALAVWVVAEDLHRQASERVNLTGLITRSPVQGVYVQNPYLPIINKQAMIMLRAADHLGFTPTSRSRIQVSGEGGGKKKGKAKDPFFFDD